MRLFLEYENIWAKQTVMIMAFKTKAIYKFYKSIKRFESNFYLQFHIKQKKTLLAVILQLVIKNESHGWRANCI